MKSIDSAEASAIKCGGFVEGVVPATGEHDDEPVGRQTDRDSPTDAAAGTGHQRRHGRSWPATGESGEPIGGAGTGALSAVPSA